MRQLAPPPISSRVRMAGTGRAGLATLLVIGVTACWLVAKRAAPVVGTSPAALTSPALTVNEVSATASGSPWGAFLRMWHALKSDSVFLTSRAPKPAGAVCAAIRTHGGPELGRPRFVSEHRYGALATIDYVVVEPAATGAQFAAVSPRSVVLRQTGGAWLLHDPVGLCPTLNQAGP